MTTQDNEMEKDPYLCSCEPCKQFWKTQFPADSHVIYQPPLNRSANTAMMFYHVKQKEDHPAVLKKGDRVLVWGKLKGVVKYVGTLDDSLVAPMCYVGVHLDEQVNSPHNGVYKGKRFFHCPRGHGAFVHYQHALRINPPEKRPSVSGNEMYPSYNEMLKKRVQRQEQDPTMDWGPNIRRKQPVVLCFDERDMAIQDHRKASIKAKRTIMKQAAGKSEKAEELKYRQDINKWTNHFGGDERAKHMAKTLKKLQAGLEEGKAIQNDLAQGGGHMDSMNRNKDHKRAQFYN